MAAQTNKEAAEALRNKIKQYIVDNPGTDSVKMSQYFNVTVKTIFRHIERLRDMGVNVLSSRGVGGGYMIRKPKDVRQERNTEARPD